MKPLKMGQKLLDDIYKVKSIDTSDVISQLKIGQITEKEKFTAAKQILLGLAILYVFTVTAYLLRPNGEKLLTIITVTFPPLATLILAAYFRDKNH